MKQCCASWRSLRNADLFCGVPRFTSTLIMSISLATLLRQTELWPGECCARNSILSFTASKVRMMLEQTPSHACRLQPTHPQRRRRVPALPTAALPTTLQQKVFDLLIPKTSIQLLAMAQKPSTAKRSMSSQPTSQNHMIHSSIIQQIFQTSLLPFHNCNKLSRMMQSFKTLHAVPTGPFAIAVQKHTTKTETQRLFSQRPWSMPQSNVITTLSDIQGREMSPVTRATSLQCVATVTG